MTVGVVVVTGSTGRVGRALVPGLRNLHRLRLHAHRTEIGDLAVPQDEVVHGDITVLDDARHAVTGSSAVVHLAAEASTDATWAEVLGPNIIGVQTILEAARLEGVPRVVFASSNHVTGQYDSARDWPIGPDRPVAPDGFYGVSKVFGEALASYYSWKHGLSVICLRIGWVLPEPHDEDSRHLWLSPRDLVALVHQSLVTPVRFGVYYGVSAQVPGRFDLTNARSDLGFEPLDVGGGTAIGANAAPRRQRASGGRTSGTD